VGPTRASAVLARRLDETVGVRHDGESERRVERKERNRFKDVGVVVNRAQPRVPTFGATGPDAEEVSTALRGFAVSLRARGQAAGARRASLRGPDEAYQAVDVDVSSSIRFERPARTQASHVDLTRDKFLTAKRRRSTASEWLMSFSRESQMFRFVRLGAVRSSRCLLEKPRAFSCGGTRTARRRSEATGRSGGGASTWR